jgi:hypothetical protein
MKAAIIALSLTLIPAPVLAEGMLKIYVTLKPAGSFVAKSDKLKGDLIKSGDSFSAEKISVSIESMKTGMSLRDEHFCKHLGCIEHPKAILTNLKAANGKGRGTLDLNGVKKEIEVSYKDAGNEITATFEANAADFNMPHAKYLGVEVSDQIKGEVSLGYMKK